MMTYLGYVYRPHRLHAVYEMRPIATDVARSVVLVYVCVTVCWAHGELCKNGWTDRDAVWDWLVWWYESKEKRVLEGG